MDESENITSIPFIEYDQNNKKFKFNELAENFIKKIDKPFGVLTVAGMYRTGKSYLLNKIILNKQNKGFNVGPTINPCTKGLWLWPELLIGKTIDNEEINFILVDTEGFGAYDEDINHDTKIFTLAILLSSYFVYNSIGTIDEKTIQSLSFVVNVSKHIQLKSNYNPNSSEELSEIFPKFCWVLRDFSLKLVDEKNEKIDANTYLENVLNHNSNVKDKKEVRSLIKTYFKNRRCFTLIRPTEDEKNLQNLSSLPDSELRIEFLEQIKELRKLIKENMVLKSFQNRKVNGDIFIEMIKSFTSAINQGAVPNIENTWTSLCRIESQKALMEAEKKFETLIKNLISKKPSKRQYENEIKLIEEECIKYLNEKNIKDNNEGNIEDENKLKKKIKDKISIYNRIIAEDHKISFSNFLNKCYTKVESKLNETCVNSKGSEFFKLSSLQNEVNCVLKQLIIDIDNQYDDFDQKTEMINEFKIKVYNLCIGEITKKISNSIEMKLKEQEQIFKSQQLNNEEIKFKYEKDLGMKDKELEKLKIENANLIISVKEIKKTSETYSEDMNKFKDLNEQYKSKFENLSSSLNEKNEKLKQYEYKIEVLNNNIDKITNSVKEEKNISDIYKSEMERIHKVNLEKIDKLTKSEITNKELFNELQNRYNNLNIKNEELKITIDNLEKENKSANLSKIELEQSLKKYNNQINNKKDELEDYKQNVEILNKRIDEYLKIIEELKNKLKKFENQIEISNDEIHKQNLELENLKRQNDSLNSRNIELSNEINEMILKLNLSINKNEDFEKQNVTQKSLIEEKEFTIESLKKQLDLVNSLLKDKKDKENQKEARNKEINELQKFYELERQEFKDKMNSIIKQKEIENDQANKMIKEKDVKINKLIEENKILINESKVEVESSQVSYQEKEKKFFNELMKKREEINNLNLEIKKKDEEIDYMYQNSQKKLNELKNEIEYHQNNMNNIKQIHSNEIKSFEKKCDVIKNENLILKQELSDVNNHLETIKIEHNNLKETFNIKCEEINNVNEKFDKAIREKEFLLKEKEIIEKLNSKLSGEKKEIEEKMSEISSTLCMTHNENNDLKLKLNQLETEHFRKCKKIEELEGVLTLELEKSNNLADEYNIEKKQMMKKFEDLNSKLCDYQNLSLKDSLTYKREEALLKQSIEFLNLKVEELSNQLDKNQEKYEKTLCKNF